MRIDGYPTVINIPPAAELAGKTAVVIDVLRATTTITTALANGAETVVPLLEPDEAHQVARDNPDRTFLLGGERKSLRIEGFHLGNSPLEYTPSRVQGRPILFTTTNGTRAIRRAAGADRVYVGSLLNAPALGRALLEQGQDVALCCAGTHDQLSLEDTLCAGAILAYMTGPEVRVELNDFAHLARELYQAWEGRISDLLHLSEHGQRLLKLGLQEDLLLSSRLGASTLLPRFIEGQVVLEPDPVPRHPR